MSVRENSGYALPAFKSLASHGALPRLLRYLPAPPDRRNVPTLLQRKCYGSEIMGEWPEQSAIGYDATMRPILTHSSALMAQAA